MGGPWARYSSSDSIRHGLALPKATRCVHSTVHSRLSNCLRTMACGEVEPQVAYGPLHALVLVKSGRMLLNGHVGEVDEGVGDVLTLHTEAAVGEARKAAPVGQEMPFQFADKVDGAAAEVPVFGRHKLRQQTAHTRTVGACVKALLSGSAVHNSTAP